MGKPAPSYEALRTEYERLWADCKVRPTWTAAVDKRARAILANKARYEAVSTETGVPWVFIGVVHSMECGLSFSKHLHNGDPLSARTVRVPAGRPAKGKPPYTWEESAADALGMKGLWRIKDWSPARLCYELERYNGFGYRHYHPETLSPYLWSGTNHYARGKYVADGKWSASAVSGQTGAVALVKRLAEIDPTITFGRVDAAPVPPSLPLPAPATPSKPGDLAPVSAKIRVLQRVKLLVQSIAGTIAGLFTLDNFGIAKGVADDLLSLGKEFGVPLAIVGVGGLLWLLSWLIGRIWHDHQSGRYTPSGAAGGGGEPT